MQIQIGLINPIVDIKSQNKIVNIPPVSGSLIKNKTAERKCLPFLFLMVRVEGFEPPTFWFVAKRSIQLGYTRKFILLLYCTH